MDTKSLYGIAAIALGLILLAWGCNAERKNRNAMEWPVTEGMVMQSTVVDLSQTAQRRLHTTYQYLIGVNFKVDGKTYHCGHLRSGVMLSGNKHEFDDLMEKYPVYSKVDVHYNPDDPTESMLEPGPHKGGSATTGWGLVLLAAGLFYLWFLKMKRG